MRNAGLHNLILLLLGTTIFGGGLVLVEYSVRPGEAGEPVAANLLPPAVVDNESAVLIVVVHPHCPCTMATARELQRLSVQFPPDMEVVICAFRPESKDDSWIDSSIVNVLLRIPNSRVVADLDGRIGRLVGARTSGHVVFYDAKQNLTFAGGITAGRGHEGRCEAGSDLLASIRGRSGTKTWPVYGCALFANEGARL